MKNANKNKKDNIDINEQNQMIIDIPMIEEAFIFQRDTYKKHLLSKIISKEEYDKIINKASLILGDSLYKKKKNDKLEENKLYKYINILSGVLLILFIAFSYITFLSQGNKVYYFITLIIIVILILTNFIISLQNYLRPTKKFYYLENIITKDLNEYFDKINSEMVQQSKDIFFSYDSENRLANCIFHQNESECSESEDNKIFNHESDDEEDGNNIEKNNKEIISNNSSKS